MKLNLLLILFVLGCQVPRKITYSEGMENCAKIEDSLKLTSKYIFMTPDCMIGAKIPNFHHLDMNGNLIDNDLIKGKPTILNFWFIACPPCIEEIPELNQIKLELGAKGINYIAIGKDGEDDVKEFLQQYPWSYNHLANAEKLVAKDFQIKYGFPTTYVLNKKSEIVLAYNGGIDSNRKEEIISTIRKELKN